MNRQPSTCCARSAIFQRLCLLAVLVLALEPALGNELKEAEKWVGRWNALADPPEVEEVYDVFEITLAGDGFDWRSSLREVPYGPNEVNRSGHAKFVGTNRAVDSAEKMSFTLKEDSAGDKKVLLVGSGAEPDVYHFVPPYFKAGFDCRKAGTPIEKAICLNKRLAWADRLMNGEYRAARAKLKGAEVEKLLATQKAWLAERDACQRGEKADTTKCLLLSYGHRMAALNKVNDPVFGTGPRLDGEYLQGMAKKKIRLGESVAFLLVLASQAEDAAVDIMDNRAKKLRYDVTEAGGRTEIKGGYEYPHVCWPADCTMKVNFQVIADAQGRLEARAVRTQEK